MAGNVSDYVRWRGDLTFEQSPFNNVDAIIFAQIVYNKVEGLISDNFDSSVTIAELAAALKKAPDYEQRINLGAMLNPETVDLLFLCAESKRFGNVKVTAFKSVYNEEKCEQFAAATFTFGKNSVIAIRGTDDFLIGWKEDCNISFMDPVPAQADAVTYFNEAAAKFKKNNLYITGQSKGGNLSLYAGVKCEGKFKRRIMGIYNLDGPGFQKEFFQTSEYKSVKNKVVSMYPEYDIVGMFFKHDDNYTIFKASSKGIRQHDTMTWLVLGNDVVKAQEFTKESAVFEKSFNEWADGMSKDEKRLFIDALFKILMAPGFKTNLELSQNLLPSSPKMIETYVGLDKETKANLKKVVTDLKNAITDEIPILNVLPFGK